MQTKEAKALIDLLNAFNELCPTDKDKDHIRKMIADMQREGESDRTVCRALFLLSLVEMSEELLVQRLKEQMLNMQEVLKGAENGLDRRRQKGPRTTGD